MALFLVKVVIYVLTGFSPNKRPVWITFEDKNFESLKLNYPLTEKKSIRTLWMPLLTIEVVLSC